MRAGLATTALLAWTAAAHADDVGVMVTGDAASQPRIAAQVEDWLRTHGRALAASALPPDAVDALIDCYAIDDAACAARVVDASATAGAVVFIHVDVEADGATRHITLRGAWLAKGREPLSETRACEACTDATLRATATDLITALNGRAAPVAPAPVVTAFSEPAASPAAPSRTLPYALIGGGAALLVTGITLIAISEEDSGDNYLYYDGRNRTAGLTLGVVGLAAASAGAYLYVRSRREGAPDAAPSIAVLPGGAYVGWTRTF